MKKLQLIIILSFFSLSIIAQTPKWIKYNNREAFYPTASYLKGFSSEINYNDESVIDILDKCKDNAKRTLSESIQVSIKSVTLSGTENINSGTNVETHEYIKHTSVSCSNISILGLKSKTYYDKRKKTAYAFLYIKKEDLIKNYKQKIASILQNIEQIYKSTLNEKASKQKTLSRLLECMPKFREIEEAQSVLIALNVRENSYLKTDFTLDLKSKVDKSVNELQSSINQDISGLANSIVYGLTTQTTDFKGVISLSSFTYQDTKIGSPFSKRLYSELEKYFGSNSKLNIVNQNLSASNKITSFNYIITGTYWEENDYLKVIVVLRNLKTGKIEASVESKISKNYCTNNHIEFLPKNFMLSNTQNEIFSQNEIVNGDLKLEVWTNKGQDNLLFSKNDTLRLYIRTNKECYIRCVYYMADNSKILLLDNFYIGVDKVNKVYRVPDEFVCAAPFGAEVMQVNAQAEKFSPLVTQEQYGYNFIKEDLGAIVKNSRGFKKIKNTELVKAEKRLIISTMAK